MSIYKCDVCLRVIGLVSCMHFMSLFIFVTMFMNRHLVYISMFVSSALINKYGARHPLYWRGVTLT